LNAKLKINRAGSLLKNRLARQHVVDWVKVKYFPMIDFLMDGYLTVEADNHTIPSDATEDHRSAVNPYGLPCAFPVQLSMGGGGHE
jgi:hypothetical protein